MIPSRISTKLFISNPEEIQLSALISVFHRWIRDRLFDDVLVDVADYQHVQGGPGILLIGHKSDIALDMANGRPGIQYRQKRGWGELETQARIRRVIYQVFKAASLLTAAPELSNPLTFATGQIEMAFPDRFNVPNNAESYAHLRTQLQAVTTTVYETSEIEFNRLAQESRRPLTVLISSPRAPALQQLFPDLEPLAT